jgi:hypothetical protein
MVAAGPNRRTVRQLTALFLATILTGCAVGPPAIDGNLDRQREQAHEALDRWASAVAAAGGQQSFSMTESRTGQIGSWEPDVGDNNKAALYGGLVEATAELSPDTPAPDEVRWDNGISLQVQLISAVEALNEIRTDPEDVSCQGCARLTPLKVTGATLSTKKILTSRGSATAPVWEFPLEGSAVRITRVAVTSVQTVTVSPPPWDPDNPLAGLSVESAVGSATGLEMTVIFTGAPDPASQGCGIDYETEAVESSLAVVVILIEHPNPLAGACPAVGATRTAKVQLAAPLGDRAVLEVQQGLPVPVTLTDS